MKSMVRISALLWADILVAYALFVMQKYLTDVWELSFTHAAGILNIWSGISMVLPVFFLWFVDELLGNFVMLLISAPAYSLGIGFVTMSVPPVLANSTGTCKQYDNQCIGRTQEALFYTGMALIAVGIAGNRVSVCPFLEEQNDRTDENGCLTLFLKLPSLAMVVVVPIVGAIALPYIKPWTLRFGIPAICTAFATFLFLTGLCCYRYDPSSWQGSPATNICRVFVASFYKMFKTFPLNAEQIYSTNGEEFRPTRFLRCLEKAAILQEGISRTEQERNRWKLCSVEEVEEAKKALRMVPMWLTFIICGIVSSIGNTYFVEQADNLNRHIGKWKVPLPALLLFFRSAKKLFGMLAGWILAKRRTYGPPGGIAVAMVFSILCCITAARTEQRRLNVIRKHNLINKPDEDIPMSIYWLLFQFFLLSGLDAFYEKSVVAFYIDQAPISMEKYFPHLTQAVLGLGYMCSVLSVYVVGKISEKGGKPNWFQFTLNKSHVDRYYWVLSALSSVNLIVFIMVASCYRYREHEGGDGGRAQGEIHAIDTGGEAEHRQCCCSWS